MRTLTDFKKLLTIGAKLHTVYHTKTNGKRDENGMLIL